MVTRYCAHCHQAFQTYPSTKRKYCDRPCYERGKPSQAIPVEQRFWDRVAPANQSGCRLWMAGRDSAGYGVVGLVGNRSDRAHRVAWQLANGRKLGPGDYVCHTCDTPLCCEPSHLWIGDHAANQADKRAKGRNVIPVHCGEHNGQARLTASDVIAIREAYATGRVDHETLAAQYGTTYTNVGQITRGETWRHIGGPITNGVALRHPHR